MRHLTQEERNTVQRIKSKWTEICNGLLSYTGSMRPLLMLEFQGYLDYLKIIENQIAFWEIKSLEINHKLSSYGLSQKLIELKATSLLEIYLPGKIGEVSIYLSYFSDEDMSNSFKRWEAVINDIEDSFDDKK
jgi:hypothetical protein